MSLPGRLLELLCVHGACRHGVGGGAGVAGRDVGANRPGEHRAGAVRGVARRVACVCRDVGVQTRVLGHSPGLGGQHGPERDVCDPGNDPRGCKKGPGGDATAVHELCVQHGGELHGPPAVRRVPAKCRVDEYSP